MHHNAGYAARQLQYWYVHDQCNSSLAQTLTDHNTSLRPDLLALVNQGASGGEQDRKYLRSSRLMEWTGPTRIFECQCPECLEDDTKHHLQSIRTDAWNLLTYR
jgi:hypothetical protein